MNDKQMKEQPSLWSAADLFAQCLAKGIARNGLIRMTT